MTTQPARVATFEVGGELPAGTTLLEASAGTGKTFTIAALAARYVAEGRARLDEVLLVTFGRAATQELRERVRRRFVETAAVLADPVAALASGDEINVLLATGGPAEVARRRGRLLAALAHFDAAVIATTHEFCARTLEELGLAGDREPDATFVEDVSDLVREATEDLYVRKYGAPAAGPPAFTLAAGIDIAHAAVAHSEALLEPGDADRESRPGTRVMFARRVREEVDLRKRRQRVYSYDDLQTRLLAALRDPDRGEAALHLLHERYRVVLVDEFQDTDPVQWEIFRRAFHGHATLVLIGDPKQAIYAFRGADVVSYLDAAGQAGTHATLGTNRRSDRDLLTALNILFDEASLGDPRIVVHRVGSVHEGRLLREEDGAAVPPMRLRVLPRTGLPSAKKELKMGPAREAVAADVARDVARLLTGPARLHGVACPDDDPRRPPEEVRAVPPGGVAVLVRTNTQAVLIREALGQAGVPAVLTGTSSVFGTVAAGEWLTLLLALEQPHSSTRVRAAALTSFLGKTVEDLDDGGENLVVELGGRLRDWAAVVGRRGIAALLELVVTSTGLTAQTLRWADGERGLTDLRHIGQSLHAAAMAGRLGLSAVTEWLRRRMEEAAGDVGLERSRRLETDAAAVQVVTVHRSKGLEFPVVYVPFGWDRWTPAPEVLLLHDDAGRRVLDVGGRGGGRERGAREARHQAEENGEDLRLLYVALTRAQCQVVVHWAPGYNSPTSAMHRLLFGRTGPGSEPIAEVAVPRDADAWAALSVMHVPGVLEVERVEPGTSAVPAPRRAEEVPPELDAAQFHRRLDTAWRRTSYSSLTAGAHVQHGGVGSEPEDPLREDEPAIAVPAPGPGGGSGASQAGAAAGAEEAGAAAGAEEAGADADLPSPMADLPADAAFGTLVHALLETADVAAADPAAELLAAAQAELARRPDPRLEAGPLAEALLPSVRTPLGPLAGGLRLCDIPVADRLAELDFEFPLAGGEASRGGRPLTLGDLAPLLRAHLPEDDPLRGYAEALTAPALAEESLRGYLNGSIDAVLRIRGEAGPRYVVVDYKTNWLGAFGPNGPEPLTTRPYRPPVLAGAMMTAHYPLQALVYTVALHRFLRWRQPGYDPRTHLGGVLYLFLRGMCGPETPAVGGVPCGVFSWLPPASLVVALSDLLDRGAA